MLCCLQVSDIDVAGEPEARRVARAKRLAEQQRRIAEQVAAQQAAAVAEAAAKEQRGSIRDQLKPRIEQWQAGKKVRASKLNLVSCNLLQAHSPALDIAFAPLWFAQVNPSVWQSCLKTLPDAFNSPCIQALPRV